jgi:hypothetical protein
MPRSLQMRTPPNPPRLTNHGSRRKLSLPTSRDPHTIFISNFPFDRKQEIDLRYLGSVTEDTDVGKLPFLSFCSILLEG